MDRSMPYTEPAFPLFRWLVGTPADLSRGNRQALLSNLFTRTTSLLLAAACEVILAATAWLRHPEPLYLVWLGAVLLLLAFRLGLLTVVWRASAARRPTPTTLFIGSSLLWALLLGVGCLLCNLSGDPALYILGNVCTIGVLGGLAARNAGTPRLVLVQIHLVLALLCAGVVLAPDPWLKLLLLQAPFCAAGFTSVSLRTHRELVAMLRAQEENARLARRDGLTDLPNRLQLTEAVAARTYGGAGRAPFALLLLDLDGFKPVNDSLGHGTGDALLREVADRLRREVTGGDLLGRLGGDEFVVIAADRDRDALEALAGRLVHALREPFVLENAPSIRIGASLGAALYPRHADGFTRLLSCADKALYAVKATGKGGVALFDPDRHASDDSVALLRSELDEVLRSGGEELRVEYQPIVRLSDGTVSSREALVRWQHGRRGLLGPGSFIPLAERSGLIVPLGAWVLRRACGEAVRWHDGATLSVNVSPAQLQGEDFAATVAQALAGSGLPAARLELEVTETVLLSDDPATARNMAQIQRLGVRLALDDFGTGFSSLSNLCRFPFDRLKIDRSFVTGALDRRESAAVIRGTLGLAHELGMSTTAEGVETPEQLDFVRACGCTHVQGFLLGRPEPGTRIPLLMPAATAGTAP